MNHKHLLAGVAAAAIMAAGNAYAGAHASVEDQVKAQGAAIDALSKEVEAMKAGGDGAGKGVKGVNLKISGHVNRSVLFINDGNDASRVRFTDSDTSSTRVRWDADSSMSNGMKVGARIEMEMESNSSVGAGAGAVAANQASAVGLGGSQRDANDTFQARNAYVFISGGFGTLTTGMLNTAHENITHMAFNYASLAGVNFENTLGTGTAGGGFLGVGDGYREDGIRYDTPSFGGLTVSVSTEDRGDVHAAARYQGKLGGVGILAGVGYGVESENGASGQTFAGSMGIDFGVVALNGAFGIQEDQGNVNNNNIFAYMVGLAHKGNYVEMGATSIGIQMQHNNGGADGSGNRFSYIAGLVQSIAPGADAYASANFQGGVAGLDDAFIGSVGMRVRF